MKDKPIPVLFTIKENCCGCTACYAVCPEQAITMQPDDEGFDYPLVDDSKCIRCNCCINVCPIKNAKRK